MQKLKESFSKDGFTYNMVYRSDVAAIFAQNDSGKVIAFEAIKIKICAGGYIKNIYYPEREVYPTTNDWGVYGFTYHKLEDAMNRVKMIETSANQKKVKLTP